VKNDRDEVKKEHLCPARAPGWVVEVVGGKADAEKEAVAKEGDGTSVDASYKNDEKTIIPAFRGGIETTTTTSIEVLQSVSKKMPVRFENESSGGTVGNTVVSSQLTSLSCPTGRDVSCRITTFSGSEKKGTVILVHGRTMTAISLRRSGLLFASGYAVSTSLAPHTIKLGGMRKTIRRKHQGESVVAWRSGGRRCDMVSCVVLRCGM